MRQRIHLLDQHGRCLCGNAQGEWLSRDYWVATCETCRYQAQYREEFAARRKKP